MPRVGDFKSFLLSLGSRFGLLRHWGWSAMPRRQPSSGEPKKIPHPDAPNPWDPRAPPLRGSARSPQPAVESQAKLSSRWSFLRRAPLRGSGLPGRRARRGGCPVPVGAARRRGRPALELEAWEIFFFHPPFPSLLPSTAASAGPAAKPGVGALRHDPPASPQLAAVPPFILLLLLLLLALSCAAEGLQLPWIRRRFRSSARLSRNSHLCAEETGHPEPPARLARHRPGSRHRRHPPDPAPGHTACLCLQQGKKPTQRINKWGKKSPFLPIRHPRLCRGHRREVWHGAAAAALQGRPDTRWEGVCRREPGRDAGARAGAGRGRPRSRQGGRCRQEGGPGCLPGARTPGFLQEQGGAGGGWGAGVIPAAAGAFPSPGERGAPHEAAAAVPQFPRMMKWSSTVLAVQPGTPARWGPLDAPWHPAPGRR